MVRKQRRRISYVLPLANSAGGHRLGINGLAVDAENSILYSGGRDGVICSWDLDVPLSRNHSAVTDTTIHSHSSFRDTNSYQSPLISSKLRHTVQAHTHWINDIALVNNNEALVSASSDITVKLWRPAASPKSSQTLGVHGDYVKCLSSPAPDSSWIASGGLDRKVCLWDLSGAGSVLKIDNTDDNEPSAKGSIYALNTTRNLIAAGGPESVVRIWDARSGDRVTKFVGHTDMTRSVLISENEEKVISASSDQTIKVWDLRGGRCIYTMTMHNDSVWGLYSNHPNLDIFWSYDKSGLIAKTDTRDRDWDDGLCVAVAKAKSGIFKMIESDGYIWTSSATSTLSCWRDVSTDEPETPGTPSREHRASVATISKQRLHSTSLSKPLPPQLRRNSSALAINHIPVKSALRLSNTAHFPIFRRHDADSLSIATRRKSSAIDFEEEVYDPVPIRSQHEYTIPGSFGLIKHIILNDKRRVVTLDTAGEVMLWDLIQCVPLKSFGKQDIDDVVHEVNTVETVAPWCSVNTKTGCLTVVLEENNCFDAEMYADELGFAAELEFKEDQRINLGKWILRYLFDTLIAEEIIKDEDFRKHLFYSKYPHLMPEHEKARMALGTLQIPQPQITSWLDTSGTPTSASTLKPVNGAPYPQTPGMGIGIATPAAPPKILSPMPPTLPSTDEASPVNSPSARGSYERPLNNDYFSRPLPPNDPTSSSPAGGPLPSPALSGNNGRSSYEAPPTSSPLPQAGGAEANAASPEKPGLFGKKFKGMSLLPKSLKKDSKSPKTPNPDEQPSDSDSRTSQADERLSEDSLMGSILRIRHAYEVQLKTSSAENGLNIQTPGVGKDTAKVPTLQTTIYAPSLPQDTPVLKLPKNTIILIQEDNPDSGGVADLYEGTVATVGRDAETVERVAPSWLAEVLLRGAIPSKELVKVSFVLEPWQNSLPAVSTEGNSRLNANRMLRARKILAYVAERVEPASERPDPSQMKAEDYLELYCHDQLISPTMTLATIRTHVWRGGGDVLLYYKANGRKPIGPAPGLLNITSKIPSATPTPTAN